VKLTGRRMEDLNVLIIGLGAAGIAVTKILLAAGVRQIIGADSRGALHVRREDYLDGSMHLLKRWFAEATNPECRSGAPADVIEGADLLIGVSGARALPAEALSRMNSDAMAGIVEEGELREDYIIPSVFNRDVAPAVAAAVADQARAAGTALAGQEVGFAQGDTMTGSASGDGHAPRRTGPG